MLISCVVGTRPEAVKMAPVVLRLRRDGRDQVRIVATGQHRELLDRALADFGLLADDDLALMRENQKLADFSARAISALSELLERERPGLVLAQGDTSTVFCAALACYYNQVPFGHVEAGLRTGHRHNPFPEELNRVLVGQLADIHFAPTLAACENLVREGIDPARIHLTGNTAIDALLMMAERAGPISVPISTSRYLLLTAHRRENFGEPLEQICLALRDLVEQFADLSIVYPVHPNPAVRQTVERQLGNRDRIHLIEPLGYLEFVALMKGAFALLTDSGGVQEEGPALGKPVLVLRQETERPEGVLAGTARLVGSSRPSIVAAVAQLWERREQLPPSSTTASPYGDGRAADRIAALLAANFGLRPGDALTPIPPWPPASSGAA